MENPEENLREAERLDEEATAAGEAARAEEEGSASMSAAILEEAVEKERESVALLESSLADLQGRLEGRRQALRELERDLEEARRKAGTD